MSRAIITESLLTGIANAIRAKLGGSDEYTPAEMATAIASIPTGITPSGSISITENDTYDVTSYASAIVNVPAPAPTGTLQIFENGTYDVSSYANAEVSVPTGGGGGIGTLLVEKSLGTISTSNTTAADTGQTVTVPNINGYDLLIIETSVDTKVNNRHAATITLLWLTASSNISSKSGTTTPTARMNIKLSSSGVASTRASTTAYGIYPYSQTLNNGVLTISLYQRYNSTQTGTINGSYTTRVYGVNVYDLIGG